LSNFENVSQCESDSARIIRGHRSNGFKVQSDKSQRIQKAEKIIKEQRRTYMVSHTYHCLPQGIDPRPPK
jgi:hypothetical protein